MPTPTNDEHERKRLTRQRQRMNFAEPDSRHRRDRHVERVPDAPPLDEDVPDRCRSHDEKPAARASGRSLPLHSERAEILATRASGFPVESRSEMTATDAAPAWITSRARSSVMPPIATIGVDGIRGSNNRGSLFNEGRCPTARYPVSLVDVPKMGPTAM